MKEDPPKTLFKISASPKRVEFYKEIMQLLVIMMGVAGLILFVALLQLCVGKR